MVLTVFGSLMLSCVYFLNALAMIQGHYMKKTRSPYITHSQDHEIRIGKNSTSAELAQFLGMMMNNTFKQP